MEIPYVLKIGGNWVTVEQPDNLARDAGAVGRSCGNALKIQIDNSMPHQSKESILLHEIIEQINFHYELSLQHQQISILETTLYQVLKDNNLYFGAGAVLAPGGIVIEGDA